MGVFLSVNRRRASSSEPATFNSTPRGKGSFTHRQALRSGANNVGQAFQPRASKVAADL